MPPDKRMWSDCLRRMLADEAHHRDVNHALASVEPGKMNPFIHEHMHDFDVRAARRAQEILAESLKGKKY